MSGSVDERCGAGVMTAYEIRVHPPLPAPGFNTAVAQQSCWSCWPPRAVTVVGGPGLLRLLGPVVVVLTLPLPVSDVGLVVVHALDSPHLAGCPQRRLHALVQAMRISLVGHVIETARLVPLGSYRVDPPLSAARAHG